MQSASLREQGILTRDELAEELKVGAATIYNWEKDGLPVLRISRKQLYYDLAAVVSWMKARAA